MAKKLDELENAPDAASRQLAGEVKAAMEGMADKAKAALDDHLNEPAKSIAEQMADKGYTAISGQDLFDTVLGPLKGSVISEEEMAKLCGFDCSR